MEKNLKKNIYVYVITESLCYKPESSKHFKSTIKCNYIKLNKLLEQKLPNLTQEEMYKLSSPVPITILGFIFRSYKQNSRLDDFPDEWY